MKTALVHDFLTQDGGAERVLKVLQELFPEAPTYTVIYQPDKVAEHFKNKDIRPSFLQKIPIIKNKYQWLLPLMPLAIEQHDLRQYDLVISSASAFAKGVITPPHTLHICYCHTPTRYLWSDTHSYLEELGANRLVKRVLPPILSRIRIWDRLTADRVDDFIANSHAVKRRIKKYYQRESEVIYPPVQTTKFNLTDKIENYFLAGGRLVPYKKIDLIIRAFNRLGIPLKIFGFGPAEEYLKSIAKPNIEFLGKVNDADLNDLYGRALAFIHPQEEDFGIMAVEAMAAGRPVIAYRAGGALESVIDGVTGKFFNEQTWESLGDAVIRFYQENYQPAVIRQHAEKFDTVHFKQKINDYVNHRWHAWQSKS